MKTSKKDLTRDEQVVARSRGRPPIAVDRIVSTALQIVDEGGAEALSMRALARRLDSGTATLYRHFADRNELIAHIVDRVFGEVKLGDLDTMGWQDSCRAVARAMFNALRKHRQVAPLLVGVVPLGPRALEVRERCIATLLKDGFTAKLAVQSWATLAHYVLGFAMQANGRGSTEQVNPERLSSFFRELDASRYPATVATADAMPVPLEEEFAFGLDLIIKGLTEVKS